MKRILLTAALCCLASGAFAQDEYKFPDHVVTLQEMVKEWHGQNLYTAGWDENPGIRNYFVGLADAYPTDLFQTVVHKFLGFDVEDAFEDFTLDERNGYVAASLGTELSCSVQMCYWRCNDGSRLIGVSVQGFEYNTDVPEEEMEADEDDEFEDWTVCFNDLAFFRVLEDELIWRPVQPKDLFGWDYDFKEFYVELPRSGKDIRMTDTDGEVTLLKWDGARFSVTKP